MKPTSLAYRVFVHHYQIKLFCLLSALFFWFYISLENQYEYTTGVPLRIVNPPEGWMLLEPLPPEVRVAFRGTGRAFVSFRFRERVLEIDLRKADNHALVALSPDMVKGLPAGVRAVSLVEPEALAVHYDRRAVKRVPVTSRLVFTPADGYTLVGGIRFEPDSVRIEGPASVVDSMSEAATEAQTFTDLVRELHGRVGLVRTEPEVLSYSTVTVRFHAEVQRLGERLIEGVPVLAENGPEGLSVRVSPDALSLLVQGGVDVVARLKPEDIAATVDFRARTRYPGGRVPAMIKTPPDVSFSEVTPRYFELAVSP